MRVLGIRIGVDASWFLVLFLFIFILSGGFRDVLDDSSEGVAYATAVASALAFFASLILHELGHALMARRLGIEIVGIDLWFFGGIAKMKRDTQTPGAEFLVAVAGPVVTLLVVAASIGIGIALDGWQGFLDAATLDSGSSTTPALLLLSWLASMNVLILAFNLVPAFPLDGGRIARAAIWKATGDKGRATRASATLGQGFAYLLIGFGIFQIVQGDAGSGLWMLVLGFILGQAARGEAVASRFTERLEGITVADVMDTEPVAIPGDLPARQALDEFFWRYRWSWFPVVDANGRFVGVALEDRVQDSGDRPVAQVVESDAHERRVEAEASIDTLLGSEPLRRHGALMAVDGDGVLRGVITLEQVRRALAAAATPLAAAPD